MEFDKELLEILLCPKCKGDFTLPDPEDGLVCEAGKLKFPIKDGVPILLEKYAESLE